MSTMKAQEAAQFLAALLDAKRAELERGVYSGDAVAVRLWGEISAARYALDTLIGVLERAGIADVEVQNDAVLSANH